MSATGCESKTAFIISQIVLLVLFASVLNPLTYRMQSLTL